MAQDVKLKGVSSRARKTGDIAGIRTQDDKGNIWSIFIEAKNSTTPKYLNDELKKFYKYGKQKDATYEIYKKGNKIFLVIHGLKKEDCTLDIHFLSNPQQGVNMQQLIEKLSPLIPPNIIGFPVNVSNEITIGLFYQNNPDELMAIKIDTTTLIREIRKNVIQQFDLQFQPSKIKLFKGNTILNLKDTLIKTQIQHKDELGFIIKT